jgi:hypothetical protein
MNIKAFIYHKRAEEYSDCQDFFEISEDNRRIAVSDGMSQSIYPQWWAAILVDTYLQNGHIPDSEQIKQYQKQWQIQLDEEIEERKNKGQNPWRLTNALTEKSGAGATLCGVTLANDEWVCECIGDTCLILVHKDYKIDIVTSQEGCFGNTPDYLDSFSTGRGVTIKRQGNYDDIGYILIVSDPFAELFQKHETESNFIEERVQEIAALNENKDFEKLVERWRDDYQMHNDDSTVVLVDDLTDSSPFHVSYEADLAILRTETDTEKTATTNTTMKSESSSDETQENPLDKAKEIITTIP